MRLKNEDEMIPSDAVAMLLDLRTAFYERDVETRILRTSARSGNKYCNG